MISFTVAEFIILTVIVINLVISSFILGKMFKRNGCRCRHKKKLVMPETIPLEEDWDDELDEGDK